MAGSSWRTAVIALGVFSTFAWGVVAGCGDDSGVSTFVPDNEGGKGGDGGLIGDETQFAGSDSGGPVTTLTIQPADPIVDVTIDDGVINTVPITFTALGNGTQVVPAAFALDRGELGNLVPATGVFTATGTVSGTGNATATWGGLTAKTTVSVRIKVSQNGKPNLDGGAPDSGKLGGNNGVGGNDYGNPVDPTTKTLLQGMAQKPQNAAELGWLYPYDKTVWPRGVLAPLLQWQTTHASATKALRIHLEQKLYSFDGYYAVNQFVNHPIDQSAWKQALFGNTGDPLHVDLYISDGATVWGAISEDWKVAPGILRGTVYYNSYNSQFTNNANGAVLAIQPGAYSPTIAIKGTETSCHVCHEVSSDGSTLYTQDTTYSNGTSYDLTKSGAVIANYTGNQNDRKFLWSGVYPDGTFALSNSRHAREHAILDSDLFDRASGAVVSSTGFTDKVKAAVTPAFSPNGKRVTFNFWEGPGTGNGTAGDGHSLATMDFDCGQADGGKACGAPPYTFSNLRELYRDGAHFPGWPAFLPDSSAIVFHNTVQQSTIAPDTELSTWGDAQAELWITDLANMPQPVRMNSLNGLDGANTSYLPTNNLHGADAKLNYEPTVNPVASGGYFWVVFTSRRMYGNVAAGDPYDNGNGNYAISKKLWVAAIDINGAPGKDPSHPAFYLPGQEINAGNLRGFWVVDPCKGDGNSCQSGEECCGGFCRQDPEGGGLVCQNKPPQGCAMEAEKCTTDGDCCGANSGIKCINGFCSKQSPN